jgi:ribonuclease PH
VLALRRLIRDGLITPAVFTTPIAAVSVGVVNGEPMLDLCYAEDSQAEVDCNVVLNGAGEFIEVQGTAEGKPFPRTRLNEMLDLAQLGITRLMAIQQQALD